MEVDNQEVIQLLKGMSVGNLAGRQITRDTKLAQGRKVLMVTEVKTEMVFFFEKNHMIIRI